MTRPAARIVLAAIAAFFWGFLFWGVSPLPYQSWRQADDAAAQAALREIFPERGVYHVPGRNHDEAEMAALYERGPVAIIHVSSVKGRPMMDPSIFAVGFGLCVLTAGLIALVEARFSGSFQQRMKSVALLAAAASLAIHLGDVVWWSVALEWKVWTILYDFSAWMIVGAIVGRR